MPDLNFQIDGVAATPFAATPLLSFQLRVTNGNSDEMIHSVVLRAQIQIEVTRRRYSPEEQSSLRDLCGEPDRWGSPLRNMLWTHAALTIPSFQNQPRAELPVPCTFD